MPAPDAAVRFRDDSRRLTAAAIVAARSTWARMDALDLDRSWQTTGPRLLLLTAAVQRQAAQRAVAYVPQVLDEQDIATEPAGRIRIEPLVGVASDGRSLDSLLYQPIIRTKTLIGEGVETSGALASGLSSLETIIATQVMDAARAATGLGVAVRSRVGYVRQLVTPSCPRCVVLAGRFYRWNAGFARHPNCDCVHIPSTENRAGDYTTDPRLAIEQGQVRGLSKADTRAILEDGADPGQVINAHRGIKPGGITTEGTTRRSFAGRRMRESGTTGPRLRPEAIYRQAESREHAVELLRRYGYVV